jgi:hypothetical protein
MDGWRHSGRDADQISQNRLQNDNRRQRGQRWFGKHLFRWLTLELFAQAQGVVQSAKAVAVISEITAATRIRNIHIFTWSTLPRWAFAAWRG